MALDPHRTILLLPSLSPFESEFTAARYLQTWLRRVYQVEDGFERKYESDADGTGGGVILAVGRTRFLRADEAAAIGRDGFILRRKGKVAVLAGASPAATVYAALHFLDRSCGVRFYMPDERFTSTPSVSEVVLEELDVHEEPYVKSCFVTGFHSVGWGATLWARHNALLRRHGGSHQHSFYARLPPERYAAAHPEIYPIVDGKRYIPESPNDGRWQPCFSEPALVGVSVGSAIRYFRANPEADYIAFSVMDSHQFCECERCQAGSRRYADIPGITPEQAARWPDRRDHSPLYWTYLSDVAERLHGQLPEQGLGGK